VKTYNFEMSSGNFSLNCIYCFRHRTMNLLHCVSVVGVCLTMMIVAQEDGDFDDIDNDYFDGVPQARYHDHDDDGSFEARRSLERVSLSFLMQ